MFVFYLGKHKLLDACSWWSLVSTALIIQCFPEKMRLKWRLEGWINFIFQMLLFNWARKNWFDCCNVTCKFKDRKTVVFEVLSFVVIFNFHWRPIFSVRDPNFSLETLRFSLEAPNIVIEEPQSPIKIWRSRLRGWVSPIALQCWWFFPGLGRERGWFPVWNKKGRSK